MSATLSRRYGRACYSPPLSDLPLDEQLRLHRLTVARRTEFEDLPLRYQRMILEAEADLARYLATQETAAPARAARGGAPEDALHAPAGTR